MMIQNRKRRPLPPKPVMWRYPVQMEREYRSILIRHVVQIREGIKEILEEYPRFLRIMEAERADSPSWSHQTAGLIAKLESKLEHLVPAMASEFEKLGLRVENFNRKEWERQVARALNLSPIMMGKWMRDLVKSFIQTNTRLIKDLNAKVLNQVQNVIDTGIRTGQRVETIRKRLLSQTELEPLKFGTKTSVLQATKNRAELIAVDQIGSFNSDLTKLRQTDLGIKTYRWRNSGDIRVRGNPNGLYPDSKYNHWEREGKLYAWDPSPNGRYPKGVNPPPEDGPPGRPYRCRCWAEPNFEDVDDIFL